MESAATDPGTEKFPRAFGNYVLLHRLASGGMGSVYLARRDMSAMGGGIEKHCIVKTLKGSFTEDPEYVARFIDEARVVVQLSHRNICQVFDVGKVGNRHYLAMEYVPGVDLKTLTERLGAAKRKLPEAVALHLAIEALDALDYAHRHEDPVSGKRLGLVHRDVSPQNVMVNFEGEVKLIDFGLAASQIKSEQTQPNMVMGKLAYMAPEHARGENVDARSDLFALAIVLYELLAGERFYGELPMASIWRIAGVGGHRPNGFEALEPGLRRILDRALTPDPAARTASCSALREELEEYVYAQHLRGGREKLRGLMAELFADDRESSRRLLSSLGTVTLSQDKEPTEPTVTIAVAPTGGSASRPNPRASATLLDATMIAPPPTAPPAQRSQRPLALAGGIAVVAVALVGLLVFARSEPTPAVAIAPPAVTAPENPPVPTPTPTPVEVAPAVVPAPPIDEKVDEKVEGPADAGVAPALEPAAPTPRAGTRRPVKKTVKRPGEYATEKELIEFLNTECPRLACRERVIRLRGTKGIADRTKDEIRALKATLNECVDRCAAR